MAQALLSRSADQELVEVAQAVMEPLREGLGSFIRVTELLLHVEVDIVLPESPMFLQIRNPIVIMKQQLERSEQIAKDKLCMLDRASERLVLEQSCLVTLKNQKASELQSLNTQLESHRSSLSSYKDSLETQERNLREATEIVDSLRRKRDEAETTRNVGIGLMFIPIVGWIAGATMIGVGQVEMDQASSAQETAQQEVDTCRSRVSSYQNNVSECNAQINRAQSDISATDRQLQETTDRLWYMSTRRADVAQVQEKVRQAVNQLGQLCAVGNVAEVQTRLLIVMEPLMAVMEEVTTALGRISGNQLLHRDDISSLMGNLRINQRKLKNQLGNRPSQFEDYC